MISSIVLGCLIFPPVCCCCMIWLCCCFPVVLHPFFVYVDKHLNTGIVDYVDSLKPGSKGRIIGEIRKEGFLFHLCGLCGFGIFEINFLLTVTWFIILGCVSSFSDSFEAVTTLSSLYLLCISLYDFVIIMPKDVFDHVIGIVLSLAKVFEGENLMMGEEEIRMADYDPFNLSGYLGYSGFVENGIFFLSSELLFFLGQFQSIERGLFEVRLSLGEIFCGVRLIALIFSIDDEIVGVLNAVLGMIGFDRVKKRYPFISVCCDFCCCCFNIPNYLARKVRLVWVAMTCNNSILICVTGVMNCIIVPLFIGYILVVYPVIVFGPGYVDEENEDEDLPDDYYVYLIIFQISFLCVQFFNLMLEFTTLENQVEDLHRKRLIDEMEQNKNAVVPEGAKEEEEKKGEEETLEGGIKKGRDKIEMYTYSIDPLIYAITMLNKVYYNIIFFFLIASDIGGIWQTDDYWPWVLTMIAATLIFGGIIFVVCLLSGCSLWCIIPVLEVLRSVLFVMGLRNCIVLWCPTSVVDVVDVQGLKVWKELKNLTKTPPPKPQSEAERKWGEIGLLPGGKPMSRSYYYIVNTNFNTCLDNKGLNVEGGGIHGWEFVKDNENQIFKITESGAPGKFIIANKRTQMILDLRGQIGSGNDIFLTAPFVHGLESGQVFRFESGKNGRFYIICDHGGMAITLSGGNNGDRIYQSPKIEGNQHQLWRFISHAIGGDLNTPIKPPPTPLPSEEEKKE